MTTSQPLHPILTTTEAGQRFATRAAAHAAHESVLRVAQRWTDRTVTDAGVARVFLALEYYGTKPYRNTAGRWYAPTGSSLTGLGSQLSAVIREMIRTGLVRHWRDREGDHLIPAPVHLRASLGGMYYVHSACLFVGEDMGPMRSRLVDDLDLVDCLACLEAVSMGAVRGL
jgi:hypothetical protein